MLRQVLQVGVFHADLHPGNVYLTAEGALGLLDFGSVGRLDRGSQEALGRLVFAVDRADSAAAADALLEVLDRPAHLDERTLERELGAVVVRYRGSRGATASGAMFTDLFTLVVRHGFGVPPQIAAAFRAFGALEGTLRLLDPQLDLLGAAREAGRDLIADRVKPAQLKSTLQEQIAQTLPMLQRLPRRIDALTNAAQRGELSLNLRLLSHPDDRNFITGLLQQLTITMIAGAAAIGAILLVISDTGPYISDGLRLYPLLGAGLFLVAFVLAARALALAFRHNARAHWGARE
ncbi:MAG TPA: AarF/UbiB family protein [Beutenbergiaceae bacterium]|nr:AarF/UbiB family protein [Beutenbergiaceae bacterium]